MLFGEGLHNCSFSPHDNDVFILALCRYHQLCKNTYFITGVGNMKRQISLDSIYIVCVLGITEAAALPGFNAFTGADQTGLFVGKRTADMLAGTKHVPS